MSTNTDTSGGRFVFDNTYWRDLEGMYAAWDAASVPEPVLLKLNHSLATELGLDAAWLDSPEGAAIFSGNQLPSGASSLAQVYAGHQFGNYSPQLGDGRAVLLGEMIDTAGRRRDIALKGSGRTPFSRRGDGKAALGPVLREYLIGEAMYALGIPTTRALAAVSTGEFVHRDTPLPGAVLTRVAASHIRVGTFEFFAAHESGKQLRRLADYVINRHYPELKSSEQPYLALLRAMGERQAELIANWMLVGFIHGVMNTDNMTLSGETIDYGPCAFMDHYDSATVFSSIDTEGRYAYANQPLIGRWNLAKLAQAMLPLFDDDTDRAIELAVEVIDAFPDRYQHYWLAGMRRKLGLSTDADADLSLASDFLASMQGQGADFTLGFCYLADIAADPDDHSALAAMRGLFANVEGLDAWLLRWRERVAAESISPEQRARAMRLVNPSYIARNHLVEQALSAAVDDGDFAPFEQLLAVLQSPFERRADLTAFEGPATIAEAAGYRTFCGT